MTKIVSKPFPDWLITTVWFIAATAAGSLWYFLSANDKVGTVTSAIAISGLVLIAIVLHVTNDKLRRQSNHISVPVRLLTFVWDYPLSGENESSWSVREAAVLMGNLGIAREQAALGVGIITTELALASFGSAADSRIEGCISWAIVRAEHAPPYRMLVEVRDPGDFEIERVKPDFRHTLAFGIILARAKKQYSYLHSHVELALTSQESDGGWPAETGKNLNPVFAAIYAVELFHLTISDPLIPGHIRGAIPAARAKGIEWLMKHRETNGLWSSGSLREFTWDGALATAWILHRLAPTAEVPIEGWLRCLDGALFTMIESARSPQIWRGSSETQRYRVEARVAAAARRAQRISPLSQRSTEAAERYLGAWTARAEEWVNRLAPEQMDVATAAFLVWGLVPEEHLRDVGSTVLVTKLPGNVPNSKPLRLSA